MKTIKLNANLTKLVDILRDGHFHNGTQLGKQLKMTRSAIWKLMQKLTQYHIKIDSIKGKGYALTAPLILLNKRKIQKGIENKHISVDIFETLPSTNTYLKAFVNKPVFKICLAEHQSKGKARLQRNWYSPFGQNIYLSFLYSFEKDVSELSGLSLVIALAIIKTLVTLRLAMPIVVKWPNDIICANKKLAGVLIELQAESHGMCRAIIGIGMNVNMISTSASMVEQPWVSLQQLTGRYHDRNQIIIALIQQLITYLQRFTARGLADFQTEWQQHDFLAGKEITVHGTQRNMTGQVMGIDHNGHLLLRLADGEVKTFAAGDVSISQQI